MFATTQTFLIFQSWEMNIEEDDGGQRKDQERQEEQQGGVEEYLGVAEGRRVGGGAG